MVMFLCVLSFFMCVCLCSFMCVLRCVFVSVLFCLCSRCSRGVSNHCVSEAIWVLKFLVCHNFCNDRECLDMCSRSVVCVFYSGNSCAMILGMV